MQKKPVSSATSALVKERVNEIALGHQKEYGPRWSKHSCPACNIMRRTALVEKAA